MEIKILPNIIAEGIGENSLAERIAPQLRSADMWLDIEVLTPDIRQALMSEGDENLKKMIDNIIQYKALYEAAPLLDVTIHPNGLAVVNTDSLAPASKERCDKFRSQLMRSLILEIDLLLKRIYSSSPLIWQEFTVENSLWARTMFHSPVDIAIVAQTPLVWDEMSSAVIEIVLAEEYLAQTVFSMDLLPELRRCPVADPEMSLAIEDARAVVSSYLKYSMAEDHSHKKIFYKLHRSAINKFITRMLKSPEKFQIWHQSSVGRLYASTPFQNEKSDSAYFF
ncbi:MAG: hypothetical protein K2M45_08235 [Muribaculaceae bacterium]|nr:hypothetical protein [Muribaculaceae bacterium]